jgi:hypothetical protein
VALAVDRDAPLLHRLEQRRLGLGRGAIDLVRQHEVREERTGPKGEVSLPGQHAHAGYVGRHQIGSELDATEAQAQRFVERPDQQRLGGAGRALEQNVPPRQKREQRLSQHVALAQHHSSQLGEYPVGGVRMVTDFVRTQCL